MTRSVFKCGGIGTGVATLVQLSLCCAAIALTPSASRAQDSDLLEAWRETWGLASEWRFPENLRLSFREYRHATMSAEELSAAQAAIAPFPEHPRRFELEAEARRLRDGPDVVDVTIWAGGPGHWRVSMTEAERGQTSDTAATPSVQWGMRGPIAHIQDAGSPPPASTSLGASWEGEIAIYARQLLWGHLGFGFDDPLVVQSATMEGERIHLVTENGEGRRWEFWCESLGEDGRWGVTRFRGGLPASSASRGGMEWRYSGWRVNEWLPAPMAVPAVAERLGAGGRPLLRFEAIEVTRLSPEELEAACRVPTFGGDDVLRGRLELTSIHDFRPGVEARTRVVEGETVRETITAAELAPRPPVGWRTVGWVVAGVLAMVLVGTKCLALRRSRKGQGA